MRFLGIGLIMLLALVGCATQPPVAIPTSTPPPSLPPPPRKVDEYVKVGVFYATNRTAAANFESTDLDERFSAVPGILNYGQAEVSIPKTHVTGELESPSWYQFEFREDPVKHIVLLDLKRQNKDDFFASMAQRINQSKGKNAFVFIHGYNVSFSNAARRTAQMSYDLNFDGAPVFYSWPSQGSLSGYFMDEKSIALSSIHIQNFLADFADRSTAKNLYVIGHSMGTRGVTQAIKDLVRKRPDLRHRFRGIILAAPDIDAEVFRRDLAPSLKLASKQVTLYASSGDMALQASKKVHGKPRAGDAGDTIVLVPGIETIDVSGVDSSILAHSYFVESLPVIYDIRQFIRSNMPAAKRQPLQSMKNKRGLFWRIAPEAE